MAVDPASGMDLNDLWLDGTAANDVANGFRDLSGKLEALRDKFSAVQGDLGMGACKEGKSWDGKMTRAREAVMAQLHSYIDQANDFAAKADAAQTAIDHREKSNADLFAPVDGTQAYPPLNE